LCQAVFHQNVSGVGFHEEEDVEEIHANGKIVFAARDCESDLGE
jgi:hypothetical protein